MLGSVRIEITADGATSASWKLVMADRGESPTNPLGSIPDRARDCVLGALRGLHFRANLRPVERFSVSLRYSKQRGGVAVHTSD